MFDITLKMNKTYNYKLEPGDATCYRFGFQYMPDDPNSAYVLDSGVGNTPKNYVWVYIYMAGGTGVAIIPLWELFQFSPEHTHLIGYLKGHGFEHVNDYTLVAVLLALKELVALPTNTVAAMKNMLLAPDVIRSAFIQDQS